MKKWLFSLTMLAAVLFWVDQPKAFAFTDMDCKDFSSKQAVMEFWYKNGYSASYDPHRLDGDNDGLPCEVSSGEYSSFISSKSASSNSSTSAYTGWKSVNGQWYYYSSGKIYKGWLANSGHWYYFDSKGVMKTGWVFDGAWYYLNGSGQMMTDWMKVGGSWYFFNTNGTMSTGWHKESNSWYYLQSSGAMKTGWAKISGTWFFFNTSGVMETGWVKDGSNWYYLLDSGAMKTGWLHQGTKWYFLQTTGVMAANTTVNGYILGQDGAWVQVQYVALGDSLAAGQTPYKEDGLGYPDYIAESFGKSYQLLDFDNFGVSGYTSVDVVNDILTSEAVRNEISEATHVTIDIGANDLIPVLKTNPAQVPQAIATVSENINTILNTIDQLNPNAKVYVMGYYNPFPYYPQEQQTMLLPILANFNNQIATLAGLNGDTFVPTDTVIAGNYTEFIPNPNDIHLSLTGYQTVAGEFWKVMK